MKALLSVLFSKQPHDINQARRIFVDRQTVCLDPESSISPAATQVVYNFLSEDVLTSLSSFITDRLEHAATNPE